MQSNGGQESAHSKYAHDHSHQDDEKTILPLSHYTANEYHLLYEGPLRPMQNPHWDTYSFHMVHDHPIHAARKQARLDKDFKDDVIDKQIYETESQNLHHKTMAVQHVLDGGIVADHAAKVMIRRSQSDPETFKPAKRRHNVAQFFKDDETTHKGGGGGGGLGRQVFVSPWNHALHERKLRKIQHGREWDWKAIRQHPGTGRQSDSIYPEPSHAPDAKKEASSPSPSPSPPRSPRTPPHKRKKHTVWQ